MRKFTENELIEIASLVFDEIKEETNAGETDETMVSVNLSLDAMIRFMMKLQDNL